MSRPDIISPKIENSGSVRLITQAIASNSAMRVPIARPRPSRRAELRCSGGSRPTSMDMKMMLSMPGTISSAVSVARAIQASGWVIHSMAGIDSGLFSGF